MLVTVFAVAAVVAWTYAAVTMVDLLREVHQRRAADLARARRTRLDSDEYQTLVRFIAEGRKEDDGREEMEAAADFARFVREVEDR